MVLLAIGPSLVVGFAMAIERMLAEPSTYLYPLLAACLLAVVLNVLFALKAAARAERDVLRARLQADLAREQAVLVALSEKVRKLNDELLGR